MSLPAFTTAARIAKRVSQVAIDLRTDHDPDGSLDEVIADATAEVYFYCWRYSPASLALSEWVQSKATDVAVYFLCCLRLNDAPGSAQTLFDHAIKQLEMVQSGKVVIPGVAAGKGSAPTVTTQRVAFGRGYPYIRTERPRSTGVAEGYKRRTDESADAIDRG